MKHVKQDFSLKAWVDWRGRGAEAKIQLFQNDKYGHVAYQIKGYEACINIVATILPTNPFPGP